MILDPRKRKTYENLKKLEIEIDLITEENRHLEMKVSYFLFRNIFSKARTSKLSKMSRGSSSKVISLKIKSDISAQI